MEDRIRRTRVVEAAEPDQAPNLRTRYVVCRHCWHGAWHPYPSELRCPECGKTFGQMRETIVKGKKVYIY